MPATFDGGLLAILRWPASAQCFRHSASSTAAGHPVGKPDVMHAHGEPREQGRRDGRCASASHTRIACGRDTRCTLAVRDMCAPLIRLGDPRVKPARAARKSGRFLESPSPPRWIRLSNSRPVVHVVAVTPTISFLPERALEKPPATPHCKTYAHLSLYVKSSSATMGSSSRPGALTTILKYIASLGLS